MVSFFDKGSKKALRNLASRHSKAHKMETKGPRDLKFSLKQFLEYLLVIKDVFKNYFSKIIFQKLLFQKNVFLSFEEL